MVTTSPTSAATSAATSSASSGVSKVLEKLAASVEAGNYYEAHQMFHSVSNRHLKQKKIEDAIALLHTGAVALLKKDQVGSGADLAMRMVGVYDSESVPLDATSRGRIVDVFQIFPINDENYLNDFLRSAVKWSAKMGKNANGDPQLHHIIGSRFFKEKLYYDAEAHFAYGTLESAKAAGHMAFEWGQQGYCSDPGYFLVRIVLQYLAQKKLAKAHAAYETFTSDTTSHDASSIDSRIPFRPFDTPASVVVPDVPVHVSSLTNFANLLLNVVQRDSADQFTAVRGYYRTSISVDEYLYYLVDRVADVWFNLGPKKQPNIMEDLMKMLGGPPPAVNSRRSITDTVD